MQFIHTVWMVLLIALPVHADDRMVARYDFEEAAVRNVEFPDHFYNRADVHGFAPFGKMRLSDEMASSGSWSFGFELDGASLVAGIPHGVLPIFPLADYTISVRVRSRGLKTGRAQLAAFLTDAAGTPLPATRVASELVTAEAGWRDLQVEVAGDDPRAAHLVVELAALQPDHVDPALEPTDAPRQRDLQGRIWFDELKVAQEPRITLGLGPESSNRLVALPNEPTLHLTVRDIAGAELSGELIVRDVEGELVLRRQIGKVRTHRESRVPLGLRRAGWYQATLTVRSNGRRIAQQTLDFAVIAPSKRSIAPEKRRFGVIASAETIDVLAPVPELVRAAAVGHVALRVWSDAGISADRSGHIAALRQTVDQLMAAEQSLGILFESIPPAIATELGLDPDQMLEVFNEPPDRWRPQLDDLLLGFSLRVARWHVGDADDPVAFLEPDLGSRLSAVRAALSPLVANPTIVVPFRAEEEIAPNVSARIVTTPALGNEGILEAGAMWEDRHMVQLLPLEDVDPRTRQLDVALRALHAWRSPVEQIAIEAPWQQNAGAIEIDPIFVAWRTLATQLDGRRFAGVVRLADGVNGWLLEGDHRDHAMVLWRDQQPYDPPVPVDMVFADGPVDVVDLDGNRSMINRANGVHTLAVTDRPTFVEGIDLKLAAFRQSFRFTDTHIPAERRAHQHTIELSNPWSVTISGTLNLIAPPGVEPRPASHQFFIAPGERWSAPVTMLIERGTIAGARTLQAEVQVQATERYQLALREEIDIGWRNVELGANWQVAVDPETGARDLLVQLTVTNRGDTALLLDAFVLAPETRRERRTLPTLRPRETIVRIFRIAGGADRLSGKTLRYGVGEREGSARLNKILAIP